MKEPNLFTEKFNDNKALLGSSMPSKKLRNGIAGYVTRVNKDAQKKKAAAISI